MEQGDSDMGALVLNLTERSQCPITISIYGHPNLLHSRAPSCSVSTGVKTKSRSMGAEAMRGCHGLDPLHPSPSQPCPPGPARSDLSGRPHLITPGRGYLPSTNCVGHRPSALIIEPGPQHPFDPPPKPPPPPQ